MTVDTSRMIYFTDLYAGYANAAVTYINVGFV